MGRFRVLHPALCLCILCLSAQCLARSGSGALEAGALSGNVAVPHGGAVLNVAHRGASGSLPEETAEAYHLAIELGADFIECDVVLSRDLVPICRHDADLAISTDVASRAEFAGRQRSTLIDADEGIWRRVEGYYSIDFTLAEIKTLGARQPRRGRDTSFDGLFRVITLDEYVRIALAANRTIGIYPEVG